MACVLPLFAFGFGTAYFDYQADVAEAGQRALGTARTLSLLVQREIEARLATLQVLAMTHSLEGNDIASFRVRAEAVVAQQAPGAAILVLREDGQQMMNTALPPDATLPARSDTTSLHRLFATAQPYVSDVFIDAVKHQPIVAFDVPVVRRDGSVAYSLTLDPTVDAFAEIVHRQQLGTDSIVSIIDRQGVIIARTPNDREFVGKKVGAAMLPHLLTQPEGIVETISQEGVAVIAAFSHVPVFGWSVAIGLPRTKLIETGKHAALVTFGVGTICLALGLVSAIIMAGRIARPIAALRDLSVALEKHHASVDTDTGLAETDEVARALVAASDKRQAAEDATRNAERLREQFASLLSTVVDAAPSLIYAKDLAGRVVMANGAFLEAVGRTRTDVVGWTDLDFRNDRTQAEAAAAIDRRVMTSGEAEASEDLIGTAHNRPRVWLSTRTPLRNPEMQVIGLVSVAVDITERKQIEDRLRQMVNELNHRVKNTLATVQSMAFFTLRGTDNEARKTLEGRLMALASAHDVLTREGWEGADLADIIACALVPDGGTQDSRFQISGPNLRLKPRAAVALALGLHELMTNAVKFGALSVSSGRVELRWAITPGSAGRLHMVWCERHGPPVIAPVRTGFGVTLIERSLTQDLSGKATVSFAVEGVTCIIDALLAEVAATAEVTEFPGVGNKAEYQEWN